MITQQDCSHSPRDSAHGPRFLQLYGRSFGVVGGMRCASGHARLCEPRGLQSRSAKHSNEKVYSLCTATLRLYLLSLSNSLALPLLPLLHQKQMQRRISQHQKHATINRQPNRIVPKRQNVESESRQDRRTGDLDVEAVLVVHEREVADFVDDEAFEAVVEDGELTQVRSARCMEGCE